MEHRYFHSLRVEINLGLNKPHSQWVRGNIPKAKAVGAHTRIIAGFSYREWIGGSITPHDRTSTWCWAYVNGVSSLPVMVRRRFLAAQSRPVAQVQVTEVMAAKSGQLASGVPKTKLALYWYHWTILNCNLCSRCHLLRMVQFGIRYFGSDMSFAVGERRFRLGEPDWHSNRNCCQYCKGLLLLVQLVVQTLWLLVNVVLVQVHMINFAAVPSGVRMAHNKSWQDPSCAVLPS
jgi:hypothetical protein